VMEGDFLQKPYTPSELGQRIRQLLARGEAPAAARRGLARG